MAPEPSLLRSGADGDPAVQELPFDPAVQTTRVASALTGCSSSAVVEQSHDSTGGASCENPHTVGQVGSPARTQGGSLRSAIYRAQHMAQAMRTPTILLHENVGLVVVDRSTMILLHDVSTH